MALVSSGGGHLRIPKYLPGHAPTSLGIKHPKPMKPIKAPKTFLPGHAPTSLGFKAGQTKTVVPKVTTPVVPGVTTPAGAPDPTTDPFEFIKSLMTSTDPAAAKALIDSVYAPARQEINNQIAQLQGTSAAQAKQMQDVYLAFEQYLSGMPGEIQKIYGQQGATDAASLMKGPVGGVQGQLSQFTDINNNLLSEEGKNWAAYAAAQPHIYALMATQNIKQMLGVEQANETTLRSKLLDLSQQEAGQILSYLQTAQDKDTQLQEWAYSQKQAQTNASASQANATLKTQQGYLDSLQKQRQVDFNNAIVTGQSVAQAQKIADANYQKNVGQLVKQGLLTPAQGKAAAQFGGGYKIPASAVPKQPKANYSLSSRYGYLVDGYGQPILNSKGQKQMLPPAPKAATKAGKWTFAPEWISKQAGVIMGYSPNGTLQPVPKAQGGGAYKPGAGSVPKTPKSGKAAYGVKDLSAAQYKIQTDISTRKFKSLGQAYVYYLNLFGGLVRAGYKEQIKKYVRQAWATNVPKKKSSTGGLVP